MVSEKPFIPPVELSAHQSPATGVSGKKKKSATQPVEDQIRLNSLCLAQSLSAKNLISPSRSIYLVISYHQQMQLGTLVSGLILISHSLAMLGRSARLVLLMSGILSDSEDI